MEPHPQDEETVLVNGWLQVTDSVPHSGEANFQVFEWKQKFCALSSNCGKLFLYDEDIDGKTSAEDTTLEDEFEIEKPQIRFHKSKSTGSFLESRRSSAPNVQVKADVVDGSGANVLKQFLSKKLPIPYLRRARSTSKIGAREKEGNSEPPRLVSWRSHESLLCVGEKVESIDMPLRGLTVVRPVHSTVLHRSHCFQITTPLETRYFTCNSAEDANNWVAGLKEIIYPNRDKEKRVDTSLDVWLFEAKGLPSKKRYYCEIVLDKVLYGRTSTKLKSDILFWGEQFSFDDLPGVERLCLYVFRENDSKKKRKERSVFVGSVEVPLNSIPANNEVEQWLSLRLPGTSPRPSPKNSGNKSDQLSIRAKVKYQTVSILPISKYKELHEYIKQNYFLLCKELEPSISLRAKDDLAQTLLRILQVSKQEKEFLADIIIAEVNSLDNENLTFRGNTLATKSMDAYMKMVGHKYLHKTFAQFIKRLYDLEEEFEVDPTKLTNGNLMDNQKNLLKLVEEAWACVLGSHYLFPTDLQETFYLIKKRCEAVEKDVSVKLISGSIFLRFLCPAILSPSLFHLTREYPDERTGRCLTLIAKALQNLANFTRFGGKEEYMESLNEFVERELPNMKNFLDRISSKPEHAAETGFDTYIDIGRELAVMSKLLTEQLPLLNEESRTKLCVLKPILETLNENTSYAFGSKSKDMPDVQLDRLSPMTRSYSLPKNTEHKSFRSMSAGGRVMQGEPPSAYKDCALSSAQDYVSGCSLITHTPCKPKTAISKRTKGRASDQKLRFWSSGRSSKSQNSSLSLDQSNFVRSSSFHGRSSREERMNHLPLSRSFDTGNRSSDVLSPKPDLRLKALSDPIPPGSVASKPGYSTISADDNAAGIRSNSFANSGKSLSAGRLHEQNIDGDKTIRRLPDIIHETVTWNDITQQPDQPLYFSPATEPMTPLGNRNFKFGFGYGNDIAEDSLKDVRTTENSERKMLKKSQSASLNGDSRSATLQLADGIPLAVPISYNTWSSKSSDSDSLTRSGQYGTSLQDLNSPDLKSERSAVVGSATCADLNSNVAYRPRDCLEERYPIKEHSDSILSGYSSVYSDQERPSDYEEESICSVETCSCNYPEDQENSHRLNPHEKHKRTADHERQRFQSHRRNGSFFDDRPNGQEFEDVDENHLLEKNMETESSVKAKNTTEYENENSELRRQLQDCQVKLRVKEEELSKYVSIYEQKVAAYKKKITETESRLRKQKKEKDEQMKSIISRLMNVEGELRKEQTEMQEVVDAKQHIIEVQEKRIKSLDTANRRLVAALTQLRNKYSGRNGTITQHSKSADSENRTPKDKNDDVDDSQNV